MEGTQIGTYRIERTRSFATCDGGTPPPATTCNDKKIDEVIEKGDVAMVNGRPMPAQICIEEGFDPR